MADDSITSKGNALFTDLEATFNKIGFAKEQIIAMDITAGAYLVANPTGDLPRVICALDGEDNFKLEYSRFTPQTTKYFVDLVSLLHLYPLIFVEGEVVDESDGSILNDFMDIPPSLDSYPEYFRVILDQNNEFLSSLKIYLTFHIEEPLKKEIKKKSKQKKPEIPKTQDEQTTILQFITTRPSKSIQSRHLLEIFPDSSKDECLQKLKQIAEQGYIKQAGSWFKLA